MIKFLSYFLDKSVTMTLKFLINIYKIMTKNYVIINI
jgi:hypothetical protein